MGPTLSSLGPTRPICRREQDWPALERGMPTRPASPSRGSQVCLSSPGSDSAVAEISDVLEAADAFVESFGFALEEGLLGLDLDLDRVVIRHVLQLDAQHGNDDR